jgi:signal transduction histidine kinase
MPRAWLRVSLALMLAAVVLLEVLSLLQGVHSVRRLQARAVEQTEARVAAARPQFVRALLAGGPGRGGVQALALRLGVAAEANVLDASAGSLASPSAPGADELGSEQRRRLLRGQALTLTSRERGTVQVVSYLPVPEAGVVLRLASPANDLDDEMREQQRSLLGHLASLTALVAAWLLVLRRGGEPSDEPTSALLAYEQAMARLRDRGEQVEARHQAERLQMEEAIREKDAMARAGELTAGIVHEVRNGLGTIVGYARMLERQGLPEDPAVAVRSIHEECDHLEGVVSRFTAFIRLETLRLDSTDVRPLVERVLAREGRAHEGVAARVVGEGSPVVVEADEEMLERAIENLVRNAFEAAEKGGGHVEVELGRGEHGVELLIGDDGPGLAPDHPGEIQPFYSTRPGGLGLGLPLARKIVLLHGGSLSLEPREPRGLTVSVLLPAGRREEPEPSP